MLCGKGDYSAYLMLILSNILSRITMYLTSFLIYLYPLCYIHARPQQFLGMGGWFEMDHSYCQ